MSHTPGPWLHVCNGTWDCRVVADGHGFDAPYRLAMGSGHSDQQHADHALIAAAPDLLAVLERIVANDGTAGRYDAHELLAAHRVAREAIDRARGES